MNKMSTPMSMNMHMNMSNHSMSMMKMYFNEDLNFYLLFGAWLINSTGKLAIACVGSGILAILYELFKRLREYHLIAESRLERSSVDSAPSTTDLTGSTALMISGSRSMRVAVLSRSNLVQTIMHLVQITISYFLMLMVMSFNTYIFVSVVLGFTIGYFIGNTICTVPSIDRNEHCQ